MRKFKITEEQYSHALSEGVTLNADVSAARGDVKQAINNAKQEAQKNGLNLSDTNIQIKASDTNESRLISRKTLSENRLKVLKEHSEFYNINDFIQRLK